MDSTKNDFKMDSLLADPNLAVALNRDGYVTVPFLTPEALEKAREAYYDFHPNHQIPHLLNGIHMTSWCPDFAYKMNVARTLQSISLPASDSILQGHRCLNHVFIIKVQGEHTTFPVHQDWNVVDETKYTSVNIWIPLWDVDENSGALWILRGSHRINRPVRGAGCLFPNYYDLRDYLKEKATSINVKAGTAVIFYHNTIHGSPPNTDGHPRVVIAFSAVPEKAPLHIYFQKDEKSPLEVHQPDDDFMYRYDNLREETRFRGPTEKPVETRPSFRETPLKIEELEALLVK
ncbi:MAG: phytanoyl-CoA dioxygenase family protein [Saprospiraceae bacterium]